MDSSVSGSRQFAASHPALSPIICFSHLRWDFVLQRPQHLMQRFSRERRVFFFEEFIPTDHHLPYLEFHAFEGTDVVALRPRIPGSWNEAARQAGLSKLVDQLLSLLGNVAPVLWFYTPMMYPLASHVDAAAVVYDCMDELSNFRFAPPELRERERELMARADVVFTGGFSIFEAKRRTHRNIHSFPSSVDTHHFRAARNNHAQPRDQRAIPGPRLGYYGVIDERIDLGLIGRLAAARPDWSIVMVGPVVKISEAELPKAPNIHYLGKKDYAELPAYLAGWDVALMPFALNESTRFISPTKTPEYLAGGRPVVSTEIQDVRRQYGAVTGVQIAPDCAAFISACDNALLLSKNKSVWLPEVDQLLSLQSWDATFHGMNSLVCDVERRTGPVDRLDLYKYVPIDQHAGHLSAAERRTNAKGAVLAEARTPD